MSIYFDFKTINELTRDDYYRQPKEFTLEDLSQYNGSNGKPTYVVIEGIVYDISNTSTFGGETHIDLTEGQDLTDRFNSCHEIIDILTNAPKVGVLIDDDYMSGMNFRSTIPTNRQIKQDTSKFTPDDWIRYIAPLVNYALRETTQGMNTQRSYQKFILLGVLVGLGKTPQEAISQVEQWQNTGASQLLKGGIGGTTTNGGASGMNVGGTTGTGSGSGTNIGGTTGTGSGTNVGGTFGTGSGSGTNVGGTSGTGSGTNVGGTFGTGSGSSTNVGGTSGTGSGSGTNVGGTSGIGSGSGTNVGGTSGTRNNTNKFNRLYFD